MDFPSLWEKGRMSERVEGVREMSHHFQHEFPFSLSFRGGEISQFLRTGMAHLPVSLTTHAYFKFIFSFVFLCLGFD